MGEPYHDRETLTELYIDRGLTQSDIADQFDIQQTTVSKWLRKTGVVTDGPTPWRDEETLRWLYHERGMTQAEIADRFGIEANTVSEWMGRHDITTRRYQEAPWKDAETLRSLYHGDGLPLREIANRFDRSPETIRHWLDTHDIERRDANHEKFDIPKDELRRLYVAESWSLRECAERYNCTPVTVRNRLIDYDIPRRDPSQVQRIHHGEYVPLQTDDVGYPRWRDQIAGDGVAVHQLVAIATGADPYIVFDDDYHVHHKNTHPWDNRPSNLEVIREDTHMATHRHGEWITVEGYPELKTVAPEHLR